jgi:hypothetical protein
MSWNSRLSKYRVALIPQSPTPYFGGNLNDAMGHRARRARPD